MKTKTRKKEEGDGGGAPGRERGEEGNQRPAETGGQRELDNARGGGRALTAEYLGSDSVTCPLPPSPHQCPLCGIRVKCLPSAPWGCMLAGTRPSFALGLSVMPGTHRSQKV